MEMENFALLARLEAKHGREREVAEFLKGAMALAQQETGTMRWYALQLSSSTFGVFDTFANEDDRNAHLNGPIAASLMAKADELFAVPPQIEMVTLLAVK